MLKINSEHLNKQSQQDIEINKSCDMLVSISNSIREDAQSGAFSSAQANLDRAIRELQYIDQLINQLYQQQGLPGGATLHERATPENNYLLRPDFHKKKCEIQDPLCFLQLEKKYLIQ